MPLGRAHHRAHTCGCTKPGIPAPPWNTDFFAGWKGNKNRDFQSGRAEAVGTAGTLPQGPRPPPSAPAEASTPGQLGLGCSQAVEQRHLGRITSVPVGRVLFGCPRVPPSSTLPQERRLTATQPLSCGRFSISKDVKNMLRFPSRCIFCPSVCLGQSGQATSFHQLH